MRFEVLRWGFGGSRHTWRGAARPGQAGTPKVACPLRLPRHPTNDRSTRRCGRRVNDIVEQVGIHESGVSRHLRILHEAGFVSMRPDGQRRLYSLRPGPFRELDKWLAKYRSLWEARLDRLGAALEEQRKSRRTPHKEHHT
jgi:DNA-binding transcriptional ArsR family regulator